MRLRPWQTGIAGLILGVVLAFGAITPGAAFASNHEDSDVEANSSSLQVSDADEGFMLAVKFARMGVGVTQPSDEIRSQLRPVYSTNADSLIAVSQVIAIHFRMIAAANNYWESSNGLQASTPDEGFMLAVQLARKGVGVTQPSAEIRAELRPEYATDADSLIAVSQVIAIHFQTVAAANNYWRNDDGLKASTPDEGFMLAVQLARKGVGVTQPSAEIRAELRPEYATNADSLIAVSQVIAFHFQTIAVANNYWQ